MQERRTNRKRRAEVTASIYDYLGMVGVILLEILVFSHQSDKFFSARTFYSIAGDIPDITVVAVGMTFVLIIAGIDLSVGSVLALSQAVAGYFMVNAGWPLWAALIPCLGAGLLCGIVNGAVITLWAIPPFIVTLGMLEIARGATYLVTNSRTIYIGEPVEAISGTVPLLGEITYPVLFSIGVVIAGQFVLSKTVLGRHMIAIGTNEEAVRLSGINPNSVKLIVFAVCGFLSAAGGLIQAARMSSASPNAGEGFELKVIAAVVIGGTSLMGGRGSVVKSFLGVLIVAVLNAGLAQVSAPEFAKRLIIGTVIVMAVVIDYYRRRLAEGSSQTQS